MAIKLHSSFAVHSGAWLREDVVAPSGLNVTELADRLDVSRQSTSKLLNGHQGLSAEMAIRFKQAFGLEADTLMRMQQNSVPNLSSLTYSTVPRFCTARML